MSSLVTNGFKSWDRVIENKRWKERKNGTVWFSSHLVPDARVVEVAVAQ